jgi:hypothetical protein
MEAEAARWRTTLGPRIPSEAIEAREQLTRKAQRPSSLSAKGLRMVAVQSMIAELFLQQSPP